MRHEHEEPAREVDGLIMSGFVRYVEQAVGHDAACRVAATIGCSPEQIKMGAWFSAQEMIDLADAAALECGDADIGRRAGDATYLDFPSNGIGDVLVAAGTPEGALGMLIEFGTRTSMSRQIAIVESGPNVAVVEATYADVARAVPAFCSMAASLFGHVPSLFGFAGTAVEPLCQLRGDPVCRYIVRWQPIAQREGSPDVAASQARLEASLGQVETLRRMAAELAKADDIASALAKIAEQARKTVQAPRYLLQVTLDDGDAPHVQHYGFPVGVDVGPLATSLFAGGVIDGYDALVVDLTSTRRTYGALAALFPAGRTFFDRDRRVLEAYAGHASAALDALVALDTARRDRDTASALLELARAIADVRTSDETVQRLLDAMPPVLRCTAGSIVLAEKGGAAIAALIGGTPALVDVADLPADALAAMPADVTRVLVSPITVRDELLGVAIAGYTPEPLGLNQRDLTDRMTALADLAATALDSARLLERINHDAMHDRLTGLANRALIENRVAAALSRAERDGSWPSLLFIDLDRFKTINDTLGHRAGDELLRQVGGRLRSAMRPSDTLGRLGGDEFVVLLDGAAAGTIARKAAARLVSTMKAPFIIDGNEVLISCSIGVALAPPDGTTYEALLQRADVAMYDAKAQGRGSFAVYAPPRSGPCRARPDPESRPHRAIDKGKLAIIENGGSGRLSA